MRSRIALVTLVLSSLTGVLLAQSPAFGPGSRVLLDAHNAYPYEGKYADRVPRALATGLPVAIEQDLIWRPDRRGTGGESVVGHDVDKVADAPSFADYFFTQLTPVMQRALKEGRRETWPLVVLNLDFKTNEPEHHRRVLEVLAQHDAWLTTAPRTATPDTPAPLTMGPMLVLTGADPSQPRTFHDAVPIGDKVRLFGAIPTPEPQGDDNRARALSLFRMSPDALMATRATNYRRWVNFPWLVVEAGGPNYAGEWTTADRARLDALVARAHGNDLWIRFYTLNGHPAPDAEKEGWTKSYNFGSLAAAQARWRAARDAKVDFVATDQYEAFSASLR